MTWDEDWERIYAIMKRVVEEEWKDAIHKNISECHFDEEKQLYSLELTPEQTNKDVVKIIIET